MGKLKTIHWILLVRTKLVLNVDYHVHEQSPLKLTTLTAV